MSSYDPTDLVGQQKQREDAKRQARSARTVEDEDIKWLMSSKRGRRIIWRFLDRAGVFRLSFNTNAMQMAFAEGNRNEGLRLISQIHALCPELYPVMTKEQANDRSDDGSRNDH